MQVTWEVDDIKPGRLIQKPNCGVTGRYMIGYRIAIETVDMNNVYGLVSMADGMFMQHGHDGTKADLASAMNHAGYYMPVELLP